MEQQHFLTMFNFQHSQINQIRFYLLADLLLKYLKVYATSKIDVKKKHSPLHLRRSFKKQSSSEIPIHVQDVVSGLLNIPEQNGIISSKIKENS